MIAPHIGNKHTKQIHNNFLLLFNLSFLNISKMMIISTMIGNKMMSKTATVNCMTFMRELIHLAFFRQFAASTWHNIILYLQLNLDVCLLQQYFPFLKHISYRRA